MQRNARNAILLSLRGVIPTMAISASILTSGYMVSAGNYPGTIAAPIANSQDIEKAITEYAKQNNYSGEILIQDHGKVIMRRSFGLADRPFTIPNRTNTKYKLASITKLFTATLVMQLYDQGRIDLNQPIKAYLPDYTGEGAGKVTVYQLLTATSGIESFEKTGDEGYLKPFSTDELLTRFSSGKLENEPGAKINYNNADYVILGKIIERVYGKTYEAALKQQILTPLKMMDSGMCAGQIVKDLAQSYLWNEAKQVAENDTPYRIESFYAAGAMYATANDLLKFANALYGGKLLKSGTLDLLKPNLADYACGLWVSDYDVNGVKLRLAERQGSISGTTNRLLRLLDKDVTIILLTNMDTANLDKLQLHIMSQYIPGMKLPDFTAVATPRTSNVATSSPVTLSVRVTNTGGKLSGSIVDIEVKDASGTKVDQTVKEDVSIEAGETKTIPYTWTPKKPGTYTVSIGVFQANWRINYLWVNSSATIKVE